jgi:hypothetical protein
LQVVIPLAYKLVVHAELFRFFKFVIESVKPMIEFIYSSHQVASQPLESLATWSRVVFKLDGKPGNNISDTSCVPISIDVRFCKTDIPIQHTLHEETSRPQKSVL